jgi:hypothetical protein
VQNSITRTINCLEAWHRSLNFKCNTPHLNLGEFIEIIIEENESVRVKLIQSRKFIDLSDKDLIKEEKLRVIVKNYEYYMDWEFFNLIGHVWVPIKDLN